jgi:Fe-S-cluster-containing dehydrogenase component
LPEFAFSIDLNLCSGCYACVVACKQENGLGPDTQDAPGSQGPNWIKLQQVVLTSSDDEEQRFAFIPVMCNHCKNSACVDGCPTGATYYNDDGIVCFDEKKCIGCKFCVMVCPYHIRSFDPKKRVGSKCQLCLPRLAEGDKPRCVETCPAGARTFEWLAEGKKEARPKTSGGTETEPRVEYRFKRKKRS